jgi:hypothetical protein
LTDEEIEQINVGKTLVNNELRKLGKISARSDRQSNPISNKPSASSTTFNRSNTITTNDIEGNDRYKSLPSLTSSGSVQRRRKDFQSILDDDDEDAYSDHANDDAQINGYRKSLGSPSSTGISGNAACASSNNNKATSKFSPSTDPLSNNIISLVGNYFKLEWMSFGSTTGSQHGLLQHVDDDISTGKATNLQEPLQQCASKNSHSIQLELPATSSSLPPRQPQSLEFSFGRDNEDVYVGRYAN